MSNSDSPSHVDVTHRPRPATVYLLALLVVVLFGAWLRCRQATESLWLDELHTSWVAAGGIGDVLGRAQAGNQSPLYFYCEWGVVQLCGHSPAALRLLSLLAGSGLIVVVAWLVRSWTGSLSASVLAALLVAVQRDCVFFAQEARPYALVQLFAVLHSAIFVAMLRSPTWRLRVAFVGGGIWLFYLHYTTFLFLLAEGLCCLALLFQRRIEISYRWRQAATDSLLIALAMLPNAAHLLAVAEHRDNWARIVHGWPVPYTIQILGIAFVLLPLGLCIGAQMWRGRSLDFQLADVSGVWAGCWFALPTLIAWGATLSELAALFMVRYLVASVVGAMVFAVLCYAAINSRVLQTLLAASLLITLLATGGMVEQYREDGRFVGDRNEAWDEAIAWLNVRVAGTDTPLFLCPGLLEDKGLKSSTSRSLVEYCLFPVRGVYRLDVEHVEPIATSGEVTLQPAQMEGVFQQHGCWLLVRGGSQTTGRIVAAFERNFERHDLHGHVLLRKPFGNLTVVQFVVQ